MCMVGCVGGKKYLVGEEKGKTHHNILYEKNIFQKALNKIADQAQHNSKDLRSK